MYTSDVLDTIILLEMQLDEHGCQVLKHLLVMKAW